MLEELTKLFVGNRVRITHTHKDLSTFEGRCTNITYHPRTKNDFIITLEGVKHFGFTPQIQTPDSVECDLKDNQTRMGRRIIKIMQ